MTGMLKTIGVAAVIAALGVPAFAQMDVAAMTCGDFFALDAGGRDQAATAVSEFVASSANSEAAGAATALLQGLPVAEVIQKVEAVCEGQDVTTNLLSVLK